MAYSMAPEIPCVGSYVCPSLGPHKTRVQVFIRFSGSLRSHLSEESVVCTQVWKPRCAWGWARGDLSICTTEAFL